MTDGNKQAQQQNGEVSPASQRFHGEAGGANHDEEWDPKAHLDDDEPIPKSEWLLIIIAAYSVFAPFFIGFILLLAAVFALTLLFY